MQWSAMVLIGAFHGINPGMGWLFAVALGMQQRSARGVWHALPPIALGHAIAVVLVLLAAGLAQRVVPLEMLKAIIAAALIAFGTYRLWRHRHPRYGGMRVGFRDLTVWSFLMATAHGAGFMLLPFVMNIPQEAHATGTPMDAAASSHAAHMNGLTAGETGALLFAVHTLTYLLVMALTAWVVYRKLGLALLRTAWFNMDLLWAGALVIAGVVVLLA
jgi:hypothetical protein